MTRSAFLFAALLLTACAHVTTPPEPTVVSERVFCGLSIPGGGTVSEKEIERFIAEVVTPRFPDGFTVWRAKGQWKGGDEEIVVIEVLRPFDPRLDHLVREIAEEYRTRFRQEAVLHVIVPGKMEMVESPR